MPRDARRREARPARAARATRASLALMDLADEPLEHRVPASADEGVSVIWKRPSMREGLGDLPWHRDCGMGGHAVMCPMLIASVFLTPATPETGELRMLPGSWQRGCGPIDARHPRAPRGVSFAARPATSRSTTATPCTPRRRRRATTSTRTASAP